MLPDSRLFSVNSFVGPDCLGNRHLVSVNSRLRSAEERAAWSAKVRDAIAVFLFTGEPPRAEFYEAGRPVLRCGSGTLAAAHVLLRELDFSDSGQLATAGGLLELQRQGEWLGYGARGLPLEEITEPATWRALLDRPVLSAWKLGGEEDYCLLELSDQAAVADASPDLDGLAHLSGRSLIITAPADGGDYDYVLRYFAPRYGKAEDPATGSANLQLAVFWSRRLGKSRLVGRQLSKAGGKFRLEHSPERTWVMGRTAARGHHP